LIKDVGASIYCVPAAWMHQTQKTDNSQCTDTIYIYIYRERERERERERDAFWAEYHVPCLIFTSKGR
jgi:hypothetical protein